MSKVSRSFQPANPNNLQSIESSDERLFLRFYLRSNIDTDQDIARARCEKYGIDYQAARDEARRS